MSKPTIVLVHGAWADASSWNAVAAELHSQDFTVLSPPNLLRGVETDAAYISSFVAQRTTGPVVLVGHSYGGFVITNAALGGGDVKALVYVAAFAPDQGESALGLTGMNPGSQLGAALVVRPYDVTGGGGADGYVDQTKFRAVFAADVPASTADLMAAEQRPVALAALQGASGVPAWKTLPSWYLVAGADQAIPAATEKFMAERAGAHTVVVPNASHAVMVSHPDQAEDLIVEAARATG